MHWSQSDYEKIMESGEKQWFPVSSVSLLQRLIAKTGQLGTKTAIAASH
jgi:hypothetical protein